MVNRSKTLSICFDNALNMLRSQVFVPYSFHVCSVVAWYLRIRSRGEPNTVGIWDKHGTALVI